MNINVERVAEIFEKTLRMTLIAVNLIGFAALGVILVYNMFDRDTVAYTVIAGLYAVALLGGSDRTITKYKLNQQFQEELFPMNSQTVFVALSNFVLGLAFYVMVCIYLIDVALRWAF